MKVIAASFAKCGTKTLHDCLEKLGYNVFDFDKHFTEHGEEWSKIFKYGSTKEQFKKMYESVDAVCDLPACYYWEEILQAFPDAKIILTMRKSEEEWLESFEKHLDKANANPVLNFIVLLTPTGRGLRNHYIPMGRIVFGCPPQSIKSTLNQPNTEIEKRRYREHNESVLNRAPAHQLLVLNFSDGWKPLCEFLGKDIPDLPFPHKNIEASLLDNLDLPLFIRLKKELCFVIAFLVLLSAAVFYLLSCYFSG